MKKRIPQGFTITEMMLAMSVMSVILLITITFFQHQSQMSGTTTRERSGRQGITLALSALQRDILQAGYGLALYPQLAYLFGDNGAAGPPPPTHRNLNPIDPKFNQPVYGTIWINYGLYIKSTIPIDPTANKQYSMWPSLVYNLQPLTNSDASGGKFSIPAADNPNNYFGPNDSRNNLPEASANANNIGAIIYWPNPTTPGSEATRSIKPVTVPGVVTRSALAGTSNSAPPSRMSTQFTVQGPPGGIFWFAPAVVYNFVPGDINANPLRPGVITRNQNPNQNQNQNIFLGDSSLFIWDFQIRAQYSSADGAVQAWMPDSGALPAGLNASNLRYIETRIVYTILDPYDSGGDRLAQIQAGKINSITKTMRVSPRTVVLSSY